MSIFPKPNGTYAVGTCYGSSSYNYEGEERLLGFRCFYPATETAGEVMTYLDKAFVKAFCEVAPKHPLLPAAEKSVDIATNSYHNAPIADGKFPVLLYSHGMANLPWGNLAQIEHLVSQGYICFAVIHAGDTFLTETSRGSVGFDKENYNGMMEQLVGNMIPDKPNPDDWADEEIAGYIRKCTKATTRVKLWTADLSAVIDMLEQMDEKFSKHMDLGNIGAFGFSFGGAASICVALYDSRIKRGVNIDGFQLGGDLLNQTIDKPCLYITKSAKHYNGNYGTHNPNVKCHCIDGSSNLFMTDYCLLDADTIRSIDRPTPSLSPLEMTEKLNRALVDFFNEMR